MQAQESLLQNVEQIRSQLTNIHKLINQVNQVSEAEVPLQQNEEVSVQSLEKNRKTFKEQNKYLAKELTDLKANVM